MKYFMKTFFAAIVFFAFCTNAFSSEDQEESSSAALDVLRKATAITLSPLAPSSLLLGYDPSIKNRKNFRASQLSFALQAYGSSHGTSLGVGAEYPITTDLNYWVVGLGRSQFTVDKDTTQEQTKAYVEYRMYPYRKTFISSGLEAAKWKFGQDDEDTSGSLRFLIQYQVEKWLALYYSPNYSYWSKAKDVSGELSAGAKIRVSHFHLQAGILYFFHRKGRENESFTTLSFALGI